MNEARLTAIREREAKATKGPWFPWNAYPCGSGHLPGDACVHVARIGPAEVVDSMGLTSDHGSSDINGRRDDFQFIAHAREDIPWLLSLLPEARPRADAIESASVGGLTEAVVKAARALHNKLDAMQPAIENVCMISAIHGVPYSGPRWSDERATLDAALAALDRARKEPA